MHDATSLPLSRLDLDAALAAAPALRVLGMWPQREDDPAHLADDVVEALYLSRSAGRTGSIVAAFYRTPEGIVDGMLAIEEQQPGWPTMADALADAVARMCS